MQAAENSLLGQTRKMQSAAAVNERTGLVRHRAITDIIRDQGVTVSETIVAGANRIITESVGDQVVARYANMQRLMWQLELPEMYSIPIRL
ncbi:hypothetical protein Ddye_015851 [Dipteronia dyeriana]|uniref:Uncharacterized protein n=1 Tax=Dipteronia dyeriana TaxID=168575 RepID=A0AAD9WZP5_9ROSI|nr:hypothetical protein Ddye_015851 [Dipteronia dyeriana]